MTLENPAYVISADSHSAALFRQAAGSMILGTGVVGSGDLAVTQNGTPNMSVNVAGGQIWMPGTLGSTTGFPTNVNNQSAYGLPTSLTSQGPYYGYQDGTVNLTISTSSPSNPRIDIVCASIQDAQYSGSNNQPVLQVITGTPAASPVAPAAPASTVVIAQIAVGTSVTQILTANITDERPFVSPAVPEHPYRAQMYRAASYTQAATGAVVFPYDTVLYDPSGDCTTGTSAKYTCPVAGIYLATHCLTLTSVAADRYTSGYYKNGSQIVESVSLNNDGTGPVTLVGAEMFQCNAADTLAVYTDSVTATNVVFTVGYLASRASFTLMVGTA